MSTIKLFVFIMFVVLLQACSTAQPLDSNHAIDPDGLFKMPGFHQVMVTKGKTTIYIAGQVAYDSEMNFIGIGDYSAQTMAALQNLALAITAAGATPNDIVSSTFYIKGLTTQASKKIIAAMAIALEGKPFPAHTYTMIGVEALADPRALIEISSIAVVH